MAKIELPEPLAALLAGSCYDAPIQRLIGQCEALFAERAPIFFPDFAQGAGAARINALLETVAALIPAQVWHASAPDSSPRLLSEADAAVILGAALLQELALHIGPAGLRELIAPQSRFAVRAWFDRDQEDHSADLPWDYLWTEYLREARRFGDRELGRIVGEEAARRWQFHHLPADEQDWHANDCRIAGEFFRRHLGRLAHEIAIYGMPGVEAGEKHGQFAALGTERNHPLKRMAELMGLCARALAEPARMAEAYLGEHALYSGAVRPMGCAVFYAIALLRTACLLQIEQPAAPAALLFAPAPPEPEAAQAWARSGVRIERRRDPRTWYVTADPAIGLRACLQLETLLQRLQGELDHSAAILNEAYGHRAAQGLDRLTLSLKRVHHNLASPKFRKLLPFVPAAAAYSADPNLLALLVEPLYGKEPSVGVRELLQNAVDAVNELEAWCRSRGIEPSALDLPKQDGDVLIEFIRRGDGSWFLRVTDRGIGMTAKTLQDYFLRAGASFRNSPEWTKEFADGEGRPRVVRAGRFGIGAFALFLLGAKFRLWTRHASGEEGYALEASADTQLIEIQRRAGLKIGTMIEVDIAADAAAALNLNAEDQAGVDALAAVTDWFCWDWPVVTRRLVRGEDIRVLPQQYRLPIRRSNLPAKWAILYPEGFEALYWTFDDVPSLSCNGIRIARVGKDRLIDQPACDAAGDGAPRVAVVDSAATLPVTAQRYGLTHEPSFSAALIRDVTLSLIAHLLVCGTQSQRDLFAQDSVPGADEQNALLGQLWVECLGTRPMAFDSAARQELIHLGAQHQELKRHITAWQRMTAQTSA